MSSEVWTPLRLAQWTEQHFAKKGIAQARLEAELLLAHALGWQRIDLYTRFEQVVDPEPLSRFRELVKRRAEHVPRQYLVGTDEFYGLTLKVDERVLIPRDETERVVEAVLKVVGEKDPATVKSFVKAVVRALRYVDANRDEMLAFAVTRGLEVIGEAASQVSESTRQALPEIPWPLMVGMRHRLIHAYFDVDLDQVWDTAVGDLPPLVVLLEKALQSKGAAG